MPHKLRPLAAGQTLHVTAHALPSRLCFPDEDSRGLFRQLLSRTARAGQVEFHAYALMDNHMHLLLTTCQEGAVAKVMWGLLTGQALGRNRWEGVRGPLWLPKYSSIVVKDDAHLLNTYLYIDANPWRARIVEHPRDSTWTSFRALTLGGWDCFLTAHPVFAELGPDESARRTTYADLMERYLRVANRCKGPARIAKDEDPLAGLRLTTVAAE
jgi:putative transposase